MIKKRNQMIKNQKRGSGSQKEMYENQKKGIQWSQIIKEALVVHEHRMELSWTEAVGRTQAPDYTSGP